MEEKKAEKSVVFRRYHTIVVGSGAAGLNAALRLHEMGQTDIAIITEGMRMGTSRNTGSDKQTYYKLSLGGEVQDSVRQMAATLFEGGCVDGDIALAEAANSIRSFFHLVELGVPFPINESGEYIGYKTDHDPINRGTSAGPYTSKYMTEALEKRVTEAKIPVWDRHLAVRLLTRMENGEAAAAGVIALDLSAPEDAQLVVFAAANVVWATGGEAGMYQASVYPYAHSGATGLLFEAGAKGKNLTESQYGVASTKFRWNLSGSFQQCLPRYVSVDALGEDEREFLLDAFSTPQNMLNAIFLKGYQWPFDPRKAGGEGSSFIDILIYQEEIIRGRRVYLDFTRNSAALEKDGKLDFSGLSEEARRYLENCGALLETPFKRLARMNPPSIQTYLDHGIDLSREKIAVSICAQHNNGGVAGNEWWESEINRLFPIGEVNGSHGVYRPGGTALNAGQVGGLRAAQYIVHHDAPSVPEREAFLCEQAEAIGEIQRLIEETGCQQPIDVKRETEALRRRMTQYGAFIRSQEGVETALRENRAQQSRLSRAHGLTDKRRLPDFFRLRELLIAQFVYLSAIDDYIRQIGVSRNSYLVYNKNGTLPHEGVAECFRNVTKQTDTARLQEIVYDRKTESCRVTWRPVRGLPDSDQWFETAWKKYREGDTFHRR